MTDDRRVLVVDDQPDICQFMALGLQSAGFAVEVAGSGLEALARQQRQPADVVITDVFMPDMDGIETIDTLKSRFPRTRIVAMSGGRGLERQDYLEVARLIGVDATLNKPFSMDELLEVLRRVTATPSR